MNGMECDFLKTVTMLTPTSTKIVNTEKCFTCETEGCNETSASEKVLPVLVVPVLCYLFAKSI